MRRGIAVGLFALCLVAATPFIAHADAELFPEPTALKPDVAFWVRIYTDVGTQAGLIHDSRDLGVVYEEIDFPEGTSRAERERRIQAAKRRIASALKSLARGNRKGLNSTEKRALAAWSGANSRPTLRSAASHVRFQSGQADRFREGLIRSGRWEPFILENFKEMGIPRTWSPCRTSSLPSTPTSTLASAPPVSGSSRVLPAAASCVSTMSRTNDSTPSSPPGPPADLLQLNREVTGSWPLAITAYNHGAAGVRRAVEKMGTREISSILRHYKGSSFGFASRNFYAEFLAARKIHQNPEKYFGPLQYDLAHGVRDRNALPYYIRAEDAS